MNKKFTAILGVCALFMAASPVFALRCGNDIVSEGDLKNEVRLKCGEPRSIETIGFIDRVDNKERIRVMKIDEWVVEIPAVGALNYYSLVFEGNKLVEIKSAGEKKQP